MLDRISRKQDGTVAAANTANRKRMVLGNAMDYACEIGATSGQSAEAGEVDQAPDAAHGRPSCRSSTAARPGGSSPPSAGRARVASG